MPASPYLGSPFRSLLAQRSQRHRAYTSAPTTRPTSPQEGEYNPLQKMAYTSVFVILTPLMLLSGMAMSPQLDVAFNWLPALFGGRQSARSIHFIFAFGMLAFVFGHVFMVLTQGFFNNMRSMITGWYKEKVGAAAPAKVEPIEEGHVP
jgi:thiosulfate reductase cytochrome b subunit